MFVTCFLGLKLHLGDSRVLKSYGKFLQNLLGNWIGATFLSDMFRRFVGDLQLKLKNLR